MILRVATGFGGLVALFLGTHALIGVVTWQFWIGVEPEAVADEGRERNPKASAASKARPTSEAGHGSSSPMSLDYNIFCPECVDAVQVDAVTSEEGRLHSGQVVVGGTVVDASVRETSLPLVLVATMEAEPPGVSAATIASDAGFSALYAEGDEVFHGVEIVSVDTGIVILENAGRLEFLQLATAEEIQKKKSDRRTEKDEKPSSSKKKENPNEIDGAAESIRCEGPRCTIDRAFLERMMANPAMLARQARAAPYSRDGLEGLRIFGVGKGSLPQLLGLRTGDVITAIDGKPLESMDDALQMVERLRSASGVEIGYTRNVGGTRSALQLQIEVR